MIWNISAGVICALAAVHNYNYDKYGFCILNAVLSFLNILAFFDARDHSKASEGDIKCSGGR